MTRTFIETPMFTAKWQDLGLTDDDLRELQKNLIKKFKIRRYYFSYWWIEKNSYSDGE